MSPLCQLRAQAMTASSLLKRVAAAPRLLRGLGADFQVRAPLLLTPSPSSGSAASPFAAAAAALAARRRSRRSVQNASGRQKLIATNMTVCTWHAGVLQAQSPVKPPAARQPALLCATHSTAQHMLVPVQQAGQVWSERELSDDVGLCTMHAGRSVIPTARHSQLRTVIAHGCSRNDGERMA